MKTRHFTLRERRRTRRIRKRGDEYPFSKMLLKTIVSDIYDEFEKTMKLPFNRKYVISSNLLLSEHFNDLPE